MLKGNKAVSCTQRLVHSTSKSLIHSRSKLLYLDSCIYWAPASPPLTISFPLYFFFSSHLSPYISYSLFIPISSFILKFTFTLFYNNFFTPPHLRSS